MNARKVVGVTPGLCLRLLCLGLLGLWDLAQAEVALDPRIEARELVTLTPSHLPELEGVDPARIGLFSYQDRFLPIPFQIDEVDKFGRYLLAQGPSPQGGRGQFSALDELVFPVGVLGRRAPPGAALPCPASRWVELPIARSGDTLARGWVYAGICPASVPRTSEDQIRYLPLLHRVEVPDYRLDFDPNAPMNPVRLTFRDDQGKDRLDMLHGIFLEGQAVLLKGLVRVTRTLKDFRSTLIAWSDGPVRLIRRTGPRIRTFGDHYTNPGTFTVDAILQPGHLVFEVMMHTDRDLSSFMNDLRMSFACDFKRQSGARVLFPEVSTGGTVNGILEGDELKLSQLQPTWIYFSGTQGAFIGRFSHTAQFPVTRRLLYQEPSGDLLRLGYRMSKLHRVTRGRSVYRAEFLNLEGGTFEDARRVMAARARPMTRLTAMP